MQKEDKNLLVSMENDTDLENNYYHALANVDDDYSEYEDEDDDSEYEDEDTDFKPKKSPLKIFFKAFFLIFIIAAGAFIAFKVITKDKNKESLKFNETYLQVDKDFYFFNSLTDKDAFTSETEKKPEFENFALFDFKTKKRIKLKEITLKQAGKGEVILNVSNDYFIKYSLKENKEKIDYSAAEIKFNDSVYQYEEKFKGKLKDYELAGEVLYLDKDFKKDLSSNLFEIGTKIYVLKQDKKLDVKKLKIMHSEDFFTFSKTEKPTDMEKGEIKGFTLFEDDKKVEVADIKAIKKDNDTIILKLDNKTFASFKVDPSKKLIRVDGKIYMEKTKNDTPLESNTKYKKENLTENNIATSDNENEKFEFIDSESNNVQITDDSFKGKITSKVLKNAIPNIDNQSNFASDIDYKVLDEESIIVKFEGKNLIFKKTDKFDSNLNKQNKKTEKLTDSAPDFIIAETKTNEFFKLKKKFKKETLSADIGEKENKELDPIKKENLNQTVKFVKFEKEKDRLTVLQDSDDELILIITSDKLKDDLSEFKSNDLMNIEYFTIKNKKEEKNILQAVKEVSIDKKSDDLQSVFGDDFSLELDYIKESETQKEIEREFEDGKSLDLSDAGEIIEEVSFPMKVPEDSDLWFRFAWKKNDTTPVVPKFDEVGVVLFNPNGTMITEDNIDNFGRFWMDENIFNFAIKNGVSGEWKIVVRKTQTQKLGDVACNVIPLSGFIKINKADIKYKDNMIHAIWNVGGVLDRNLLVEIKAINSKSGLETIVYSGNTVDNGLSLIDTVSVNTKGLPKGKYTIQMDAYDIDTSKGMDNKDIVGQKTIKDTFKKYDILIK